MEWLQQEALKREHEIIEKIPSYIPRYDEPHWRYSYKYEPEEREKIPQKKPL